MKNATTTGATPAALSPSIGSRCIWIGDGKRTPCTVKGWATPARAMLVIECHGGRHGPREIATYPENLIPANK